MVYISLATGVGPRQYPTLRPFARKPSFFLSKLCFWHTKSLFKPFYSTIIKRFSHYIKMFLWPEPHLAFTHLHLSGYLTESGVTKDMQKNLSFLKKDAYYNLVNLNNRKTYDQVLTNEKIHRSETG
jgi:hypothetical protein